MVRGNFIELVRRSWLRLDEWVEWGSKRLDISMFACCANNIGGCLLGKIL